MAEKHRTRSEWHKCYTRGWTHCQFSNAHLPGHICSHPARRIARGVEFGVLLILFDDQEGNIVRLQRALSEFLDGF